MPERLAVAALAVGTVTSVCAGPDPIHANADPSRCDGWQCVPGVTIITTFSAGACTPHGNRYVFGVMPPKGNTYSFVCTPWGQWVLAPVLIGVREPGDPCSIGGTPISGTWGKGPAAQSPDGLPMLCDDGHRFTVYANF